MGEEKELKRLRQQRLRKLMKEIKEIKNGSGLLRDKPVKVTNATFIKITQNHPLVVIDCWAAWCGPCRMIAPIIAEMARDFSGRILFGKLNVDENPDIARQYQIMSIPTLLVFKNGKLVERIMGAMPRHVLEPKIITYL